MIKVKNLTKRYGDLTAVNNISFNIEDGHIYGLLGANGAGKSTTMNMITGCLAPTSGSITVGGHDIASEPEKAKALIGYLPELPPLYTDMTPREYLSFIASARRMKSDEAEDHIEEIIKKTKISGVADKLIKDLSKGYRQRVGIAQAIIGDPQIIILDEPTAGLDPRQIIEIRELIAELGKIRTVIVSSHILTEIEEMCDRIIIISSGEVVDCDTLENLYTKYVGPDILTLSVKTSPKQAVEILKKVGKLGKVSLESVNGVCEITIEAPKNKDIREDLFFAFSEARIPIIAMNKQSATLEHLFLKATDGETAEYPEDFSEDGDTYSAIPSIKDFLRSSSRSKKDDDDDDEDDDDESDGYKPLFGKK
ncbi:MAG: ABC transporter ATP-binding protein [Ruminococcaceae bacterium]|nr:ABC transporter ATP-binding protein [Oscillospiraceae bacterium]